jgi:tetratricopeptide (TPR) repeat protein
MKRSINLKLIAILLGAIILAGGGVHALHGMQIKRSAEVLLELAAESKKEGDLEKASEYLARYLRLFPNDSKTLTQYALLLASPKVAYSELARERALAVIEKALRLAPDHRDLRRRAVDLAMSMGHVAAARSHLKTLRDSTPGDGELDLLLGKTEESLGEFEAAKVAYMDAIVHAPNPIEGYVRLANLLRRRLNSTNVELTDTLRRWFNLAEKGEPANQKMDASELADRVMDAREVKDGLIAKNDKSFRAYLERAKYRKTYGFKGADDDVARALALAPDEADAIVAAAEVALDRGELEKARTDLDRGLKRHPRDPRMYQALASLETRARRFDEAIACLKRGLEKLPGTNSLQWLLAELLVQQGKKEETRDLIKQIRETDVREEIVWFVEARLAMAEERWTDAITTLERIRIRPMAQPGDDEFRKRIELLLVECYRQTGNIDQQLNAAIRAVEITLPNENLAVPARLELASVLSAMGRIDGAIDEYRKILTLPGFPPQVKVTLAQLLIVQNLSRPAAERRWKEAEDLLDEAERTSTGPAPALVIARAEILLAQGQLEAANQLVQKAVDQHPEQVDLWITLASLADRQGKAQESLSLLDKAQQRLGDRIELRLARGRHWERQNDRKTAEAEMVKLEQGAESFAPADRLRLLTGLAAMHQRAGHSAPAKRLWTLLAIEQPGKTGPRQALFELALQASDVPAMEEQVQELRRIEGEDGLFYRFDRVRLTIQQARAKSGTVPSLAEARQLLATVVARRPNWSEVARTEAELDDLENKADSAIKNYLRAIELGDRSWLAFRRAVGLLFERGRFEEADQLMRKLEAQTPLSNDLLRVGSELAMLSGNYGRALELARKAVTADPKDYRNQMLLGQICGISAQHAEAAGRRGEAETLRAEAEQVLRQAVALAGDRPGTWLALVQFLAATNLKKAEVVVEQVQQAPLGEQRSSTLARCYELIGRRDQAGAMYLAAVEAKPDDPVALRDLARYQILSGQIRDAEPTLLKLIENKSTTPEAAARLRGVLAIILATAGDHQRALQELDKMGLPEAGGETPRPTSGVDDAEVIRAKAKVLALMKTRAQWRKAIELLDILVVRNVATAEDRFLIAQLAEKTDDWRRARGEMERLLTLHEKNPTYLVHHIRSLLRHGDVDEARVWLGKLEQVQLVAPTTIEIKARVLAAQGRGADAVSLLKEYAGKAPDQVGGVARLLEEVGQAAAAEELYRTFVSQSKKPEDMLVLAQYYARQDRLNEALDLCEQAWKKCPPEVVSTPTVTALFSATHVDDEQYRRVVHLLEGAIQANPDQSSFVFDLANLHMHQGHYREAEPLYRRIAERVKTSGSPLNNLALVLVVQGGHDAEALDLINHAISLDGENPSYLDTRGQAYLALGRTVDAIKDLEEATALAPSGEKYFHLAQAYGKAQKPDEARKALQKAKTVGFKVESLLPLERRVYEELVGKLAQK